MKRFSENYGWLAVFGIRVNDRNAAKMTVFFKQLRKQPVFVIDGKQQRICHPDICRLSYRGKGHGRIKQCIIRTRTCCPDPDGIYLIIKGRFFEKAFQTDFSDSFYRIGHGSQFFFLCNTSS